jgi:hypothetical protein
MASQPSGDGPSSSRSSSRRHRRSSQSDDKSKDKSSSAGNFKVQGSAFNVKGLPIVRNIPYQHSELSVFPEKYCGAYMFGENFGNDIDKERYYQKNKSHAWAIVTCTKQKSDPVLFAKTKENPFKSKNPVVCTTPISALWQSACGRYVLFPKPTYSLPNDEEEAKKDWYPTMDMVEYLTKNSDDHKYNIRNGKFFKFSCSSIRTQYIITQIYKHIA